MIIKCKVCGAEICISDLDYKFKSYQDICPKCRQKPKLGEIKQVGKLTETEDEKVFKADGIEGTKDADTVSKVQKRFRKHN